MDTFSGFLDNGNAIYGGLVFLIVIINRIWQFQRVNSLFYGYGKSSYRNHKMNNVNTIKRALTVKHCNSLQTIGGVNGSKG